MKCDNAACRTTYGRCRRERSVALILAWAFAGGSGSTSATVVSVLVNVA